MSAKLGTIAFVGDSGHRYEFAIYPLEVHFKPGHGGVYFVTARKEESPSHYSHHKIYVGETDELHGVAEEHPQASAFASEGANCICIHPTQDRQARTRIAQDLIAHYAPPHNAV